MSAMYVREISIKMCKEFSVNTGEPIIANQLTNYKGRKELTNHLYYTI